MPTDPNQSPFLQPWHTMKRAFDAWEGSTASLLEAWSKSPFMIQPAGNLLSSVTQIKHAQQQMLERWWSSWGLPTRAEQERAQHTMNELSSRLIDLEEKLADLERDKERG